MERKIILFVFLIVLILGVTAVGKYIVEHASERNGILPLLFDRETILDERDGTDTLPQYPSVPEE